MNWNNFRYYGIALLVLGIGFALFWRLAAPTRIAFVNYQDFMFDAYVVANDNPFIRIEQVPLTSDTFAKASRYDVMYLFAHGNVNLTSEQKAQVQSAIQKGTEIIYRVAVPDEATNLLDPEHVKYVMDCMSNGGNRNLQRLLNYSRRVFHGKRLFVEAITDPFILPDSYYYHLGDEQVFASFEDYLEFLKSSGRYQENGKRIALLSTQFGASSDQSHIHLLVNGLEQQGHNVFPLVAYGPDRLPYLKVIQPDLILMTPHGRFGDDSSVQWLREQNLPLLCPIVVFQPKDEWMSDLQGMSGGMLSQSVTVPEIDGGAVPFVIAAQEQNERGLYVFQGIEDRVETFLKLTDKWLALQDKPNAEKKVAIFYYKEPGKNAMVAEGMEIAPSLLSVLRRLKSEGYHTGPLPESVEELEALIQQRGPVFGTYAKGSIEQFLTEGQPEWLSAASLEEMMKQRLQPELIAKVQENYGPAPGDFMTTQINGEAQLALARVPLGNIVLIPVPPAGLGDDDVKIIHGVTTPPPYPYIGAYLWAQEGFGADAIVHFGTHGSVEFTPQKQVALSPFDWPDALLAGTPHFYIYVMSNIGEAMIAKRRSYAVMNTHLTAPLMQSEIYGPLQSIADLIAKFENSEHDMMREQYRESIHHLVLEQDIHKDLGFEFEEGVWISNDQMHRLHHYLDSIEHEKITKGLHVYGASYSASEVAETVRLMALDDVLYKRVQLEVGLGKVSPEAAQDSTLMERQFRDEVDEWVDAVYYGSGNGADLLPMEVKLLLNSIDDPESEQSEQTRLASDLVDSLESIRRYREALEISPEAELNAILNSLNGGYIAPQSGGDPAFNPEAVPTGRNLYSINAEQTPSPEAFAVARKQVDNLLQQQLAKTGKFPRKVAFTLWGGEFVRQEGITVAQILYMLGAEPVRNRRGSVHDVKLIPIEELGRPRIDVVVQTSGQFRDLAASRINLINKAVKLASEERGSDSFPNYVREGVQVAESVMKERGLAPAEARNLSTIRVFGGLNGNYGASIMGLVENGDRWESEDEIAGRYLETMGAMYGDGVWGDYKPGAFEAALQNTDMLIQPRSNNTWGPLSLDHVYEFMGGMSNAIRLVTGRDVDAWFSDLRNPRNPTIQSLNDAIWMEARSTLLNPKYIEGMQEEGATAAGFFAETFRNTYGWEVMKDSAVDATLWDQLTRVYIDDMYDLEIESWFREKNPAAFQEMTAVMLEVVRKGYWNPDVSVVRNIATLHAELVRDHEAGCSAFVCDNAKLRAMIAEHIDTPLQEAMDQAIAQVRESNLAEQVTGMELKKTETSQQSNPKSESRSFMPSRWVWILVLLGVAWVGGAFVRGKGGRRK